MNEIAASIIQEYIDEHLFEPAVNWPIYEFDQRIYARWAASEILMRIVEDATKCSPLEIIDQFAQSVDRYSEMSDDRKIQFIFSIARETAEDIAFLFL